MMAQRSETMFLPDERIVDVAPRFSPRVGDPHVRRLNYVPGRSLTAGSLNLERHYWDTRTVLLGRAVNAGIIDGLALEVLDGDGASPAIRLTAGSGITDLGENVALARPLAARLADIPASEPLRATTLEPEGLIGLFLKPVRAVGALAFNPEDPCPVDSEAYAYNDLVTQDAAQLVWARLDEAELVAIPPAADRARPVRRLGAAATSVAVLGPLSSTNLLVPASPALGLPDPQLVPTSVYRGLVAHRLLEREAAARQRGVRPSWSRHGLPLGILQVSAEGRVLFVDRFALCRSGGAVREPAIAASLGTAPVLRRARFDQFLDHIQALRSEGADLSPATLFFRHLPPVGILPATVLDKVNLRCGFFPQNFAIEAAPIQLTQMESLLATRAALAPFDLARADYVQILVPVPDHLFHPRLLIQEEIADDFKNAITAADIRAGSYRAELAEVRSVEAHMTALIDFGTAKGRIELAISANSTAAKLRDRSVAILTDLAKNFANVPLTALEQAELSAGNFAEAVLSLTSGGARPTGYLGLRPVVERLAQKIDTGNDQADMGFLRLQSDIFRLRKQMVGEADATRLATSPVLANLAASTTGLESGKLFSALVKDKPKPSTALKLTASVQPQVFSALAANTPSGGQAAIAAAAVQGSISAGFGASAALSFNDSMATSFGKSITPIETFAPLTVTAGPTKFADMGIAGIKLNLQDSIIQASDIAWHSLVYGKGSPIRTATIAERLRPSPAQEAKNSAVATKAEIVRQMQALGLNLAGLRLPVSASRVTLIPMSALVAIWAALESLTRDGINKPAAELARDREVAALLRDSAVVPDDGDVCVLSDKHILKNTLLKFPQEGTAATIAANRAIYERMQAVTAGLYGQRLSLDHANLAGLILADKLDPDPEDPDEAAFFAAAVDALESAVSMLRLFEGRVQSYAAFLDLARKALVDAIALAERWQGVVDDVSADIAEAVHDAAVAKALMIEEQARLDAVNLERRDILDKHVDIIAFARPMTADRLRDAPGMPLFKPLTELLPACLETTAELPDEIEELIEALNDAPVGWYPEIAKDLAGLSEPRHYLDAWQRAVDRAGLWLARNADATPRKAYAGTQDRVAGKASTGVYTALSGVLAQRKAVLHARTKRTMSSLNGASWQSLKQTALVELSIEDLERGGKAGREAARKGAIMLRQIGAVATCFLAGLRKAPANLRLIWADQLSEHDAAVDLSDTSYIPDWGHVPLEERRELDVMHAWLFGRIDRNNEAARAMLSTLIRICLLMASHAPVSSIVEGAVVETKTIGPGESFEVDIGLGRPQIGMIATIGTGAKLNRGIIEDIVGTRARVRVADGAGERIALTAQTAIAFSAPVTVRLATVGY
jgi:hypothetical protein